MTKQEMVEALKKLMELFNEKRDKWIEKYGTDEGFIDAWDAWYNARTSE